MSVIPALRELSQEDCYELREPETEGSICITVLKVNNYTSIRNSEDGVFVFLLSEGSTIVIKDHN